MGLTVFHLHTPFTLYISVGYCTSSACLDSMVFTLCFLPIERPFCAFLRKVQIGHTFSLQSAALILLLSPDGYTTEVSDISDAALVGYSVCDIVCHTADWI